ncbi:5-carboxymethyl-2-hydroxymuconate Delta-isomerase [Streptomyces sp. WAC06614]|uniref:5-carboxymethyl-2-hydroxymuconate Delta-isomerase n=1 Tax=Streptomyces sp. WAC06614 TaxID=2487416 RepID=UPI000F7AC626|nr:isomerase [Streptomyces sp. WAC06614]RSS58422.1 isomerase [Streptomyces sp. WAC06614]
MPQITVDHSADVLLDRRDFALAGHALVTQLIDCTLEECKTRFRTVDETCIGDAAPEHALVVGEIRILPGRSEEVRTALSEGLLALLADHITPKPRQRLHLAWDVVELDPATYRRVVVAEGT